MKKTILLEIWIKQKVQQCFSFEEVKETVLAFSNRTVKAWWFYFALIIINIKTTQYNTLNVKLPNSQLDKLTYAIKNGA